MTTIYGGIRMPVSNNGRLSQETAKELMAGVAEEAERMVRLIENLLAFARVEMGKEIDRSPVIANELVADAVHSFRTTNPMREVIVRLDAAFDHDVDIGQREDVE